MNLNACVFLSFLKRKYKLFFDLTIAGIALKAIYLFILSSYSRVSSAQAFALRFAKSLNHILSQLGFIAIKIWRLYRFERMIARESRRLIQFSTKPPLYFSKQADQTWLAFSLKLDWRLLKAVTMGLLR